MKEAFREYLPILAHAAIRSFVIYVIAQGVVYITGRMLEFVHSNRGRNASALLVIFPLSYFSILIYDQHLLVHPWEIYWRVLVYSPGSAIIFCLNRLETL